MRVLWRGYCYGTSGYASAGRGLLLALRDLGVQIQLQPVSPGHRNSNLMTRHLRELQEMEAPFKSPAPIAVQHVVPHKFQFLADWNVGVTYWETTRIPKEWVEICNRMDHIVLFSQVNLAAFQDSGVTTPIDVIPSGVDTTFASGERQTPLNPIVSKDVFIFLSISEWVPRKGFDLLIRAYLEEFSKKDDVILFIKTKLRNQTAQILKDVEDLKCTVSRVDKPTIIVHVDPLSQEQLKWLYHLGDAYVLASRGEGVGLTYLEAGVMGLPVIATGWGGHTEYLNQDNSYLLDYRMLPAHPSQVCPWYAPDQLWAEPDFDHLRQLMRHVYNNKPEAARKASLLQSNTLSNHNWNEIARQFKHVLLARWRSGRPSY